MQTNYKHAPITEAIIDFRVTIAEGNSSTNGLTLLKENLVERFPIQEEIQHGNFEFRGGLNIEPEANATMLFAGYRLTSEDKLHVVQITPAGFTFSWLNPYDSWESFRDHTREAWESYKYFMNPVTVNRVAIRYINRLDLPASNPLESYLELFARIPIRYPVRVVASYFLQLQIPQTDLESMLVINQAQVEPPNPDTLSIILDFDLFRQSNWSIERDDAIWLLLEQLRERKNELFEASITDLTRELIK